MIIKFTRTVTKNFKWFLTNLEINCLIILDFFQKLNYKLTIK